MKKQTTRKTRIDSEFAFGASGYTEQYTKEILNIINRLKKNKKEQEKEHKEKVAKMEQKEQVIVEDDIKEQVIVEDDVINDGPLYF